jgi:hypothetical protein
VRELPAKLTNRLFFVNRLITRLVQRGFGCPEPENCLSFYLLDFAIDYLLDFAIEASSDTGT